MSRSQLRRAALVAAVAIGAATLAILPLVTLRDHGLTGGYYLGTAFDRLVAVRCDRSFARPMLRPPRVPQLPPIDYSIRWTGRLDLPESGLHRFFLVADDGARLWIDGRLLVDDWTIHSARLETAAIELSRGVHEIRIDYFQATGRAIFKLTWQPPGAKFRETIPPRLLRPSSS